MVDTGPMKTTRLKSHVPVFSKVKNFLARNPGAAFIVGFQALLLLCAALLIGGNPALASDGAVYAYGLLIVGIVLQAVSFLRNRKKGDND